MSLCSLPIVALLATSTAIKVRIVVQPPIFVTSYYLLHVVLSLLVLTQLIKAVKRLAAYVARKWVEVGLVIVYSRLSLVHEYRVAASNKAITKNFQVKYMAEWQKMSWQAQTALQWSKAKHKKRSSG
jgi:hypothetical protein